MKINFYFFFILIIININISKPICIKNENNCQKCNPITSLCAKCISENLKPDMNGGCEGKCSVGYNYCLQCDEINEKLCLKCEDNFFPDKTGGCSYTNNCVTSNKGQCLKCIDGYVLIGEEKSPKICKSLSSQDLKNCKKVNQTYGLCEECNEGYNLTAGDSKCVETENCYESSFGTCISCDVGYYLNKKKASCEKTIDTFYFCKQTVDGTNCDKCHFGFYLAEDGQCTDTINCSKSKGGKCIECTDNNYLINSACSREKNCIIADKDTGLCETCNDGFYLDMKDRKCKPNTEDNELKYCIEYDKKCKKCENRYFLGEDFKCSKTENCTESENGKCLSCKNDYYLGYDNRCTNIEHCIYSGNSIYPCDECEKNYYFDTLNMTCKEENEHFKNCKVSLYDPKKCSICKDNYYLNKTDFLCYDNSNEDSEYYKCLSTNTYNICEKCINNFYLNSGDRKCTINRGCAYSERANKCIECEDYYCLDVKKGICIDNDYIENESDKIYVNCNKTNEEGTACAECAYGYKVGEEGFCVEDGLCIERENGVCVRCKEGDYLDGSLLCANSVFGCISTYIQFCVKCDNITDLYACTKCEEGFEVNDNGICV